MEIIFSKKVECFFQDYNKMIIKIGMEKSKTVKKYYDHLKAADNFSIYLSVGLGKPHPLKGDKKGWYGVWITSNFRLILEPKTSDYSVNGLMSCDVVEVKGVSDYHGGKDNWIIP